MTIPLFSGSSSQSFTLSLSGSVTAGGAAIVKAISKPESGALSSAGSLKRAGALVKTGALVSTSAVIHRALTKTLAGTQATAAQIKKLTTKPVTAGSIGSSDSFTPVKNAGPGPPITMNLTGAITLSGVFTPHKSSFVIMNLSGVVSLADAFSPVTEGPIIIEVDDYVNFYLQGRFLCNR